MLLGRTTCRNHSNRIRRPFPARWRLFSENGDARLAFPSFCSPPEKRLFQRRWTLFFSQFAEPGIERFVHLAFPGLPRLVEVETFEDNGVFGLLLEMREIFPDPSLVGTKGGNFLAREVRLSSRNSSPGLLPCTTTPGRRPISGRTMTYRADFSSMPASRLPATPFWPLRSVRNTGLDRFSRSQFQTHRPRFSPGSFPQCILCFRYESSRRSTFLSSRCPLRQNELTPDGESKGVAAPASSPAAATFNRFLLDRLSLFASFVSLLMTVPLSSLVIFLAPWFRTFPGSNYNAARLRRVDTILLNYCLILSWDYANRMGCAIGIMVQRSS